MEAIILAVLIGLGIAFFATQNTQGITVHLINYSWKAVPIYVVMACSLLLGLMLAWILSVAQSLSSYFSLHKKDDKIKQANKTIAELTKQVHNLELENAKLDPEKDKDLKDDKAI